MKPFLVDQQIITPIVTAANADLEQLAAIHRINCLAGLKSAGHGWLGACFSSIDLLTCIYHLYVKNPLLPLKQRASLHLSKGHAAMAQYAILAAMGCFPVSRLLTYKQLNGLPAHCDRDVLGVDSDSGSLGQGLAKALGVAIANQNEGLTFPVFALIGDGELQEGQVFESLLTLKKMAPPGCIPIIDRNYLQSDSRTSDIKDAADWAQVFSGIGLEVWEINGHSIPQISATLAKAAATSNPGIIIAQTSKGYGTSLTGMSAQTPRRQGIWHGQIPNDEEYLQMLEELVDKAACLPLQQSFAQYRSGLKLQTVDIAAKNKEKSTLISTGQAFANALIELAANDKDVFVLDADLEKSCRLTEVAEKFGSRFLEIGISEQDMCSIAAGLGLRGKIAVVNTYASFYKRSLDQIFACITEKVPVIFAGHYAGVDYFTDGKSHQSVNDIGLMRSLGDIEIMEPLDASSTRELLQSCLERMKREILTDGRSRPAYFRLHRTPGRNFEKKSQELHGPIFFRSKMAGESRCCLFTSGPHMLSLALAAAEELKKDGIVLDVAVITTFADEKKHIKKLLDSAWRVFSLEDHRRETGLGSFLTSLSLRNPVKIGIKNFSQSSLSFEQMLAFHQLDVPTVCTVIKKVLSCVHEK